MQEEKTSQSFTAQEKGGKKACEKVSISLRVSMAYDFP
jgi:hypothetical protein